DVSGIAVHIGARVAAAANAGEVLVSGTLKDLVTGSGLRFVERGVHRLKGVGGEWPLHAAEYSCIATPPPAMGRCRRPGRSPSIIARERMRWPSQRMGLNVSPVAPEQGEEGMADDRRDGSPSPSPREELAASRARAGPHTTAKR